MLSDNSNVEIIEVLRFSTGSVDEAYEAYVKIAEIENSPIDHIKTSIVAKLKTKSVKEFGYKYQYINLDKCFIGKRFICIENMSESRPSVSLIFSFPENYDVESPKYNEVDIKLISLKDMFIYKNFTYIPLKLLSNPRRYMFGMNTHIVRERLTFNSHSRHRLSELNGLIDHIDSAFKEIADSDDFIKHLEICRSTLAVVDSCIAAL